MMFMLHYFEFLLFSVVQTVTALILFSSYKAKHEWQCKFCLQDLNFNLLSCLGLYPTETKKQMNWSESFNHCKLSTLKKIKKLNVTNVWLGGLYLQTPWMVHRGCFNSIGAWDTPPQPYSHSNFDWNITSACSYKCRKNFFFALKATSCACLNSLSMLEETKMDYCTLDCNGSKKDPCGAARFFTIYEQHDTDATDFEKSHKVEGGTTYNRRPVIKWIMNETLAEISNETANFHNVKCVLLNENMRYVPKSCYLTFTALCNSGIERELSTTASPGSRQPVFGMKTNVAELTTETKDINKETSMSNTPLKKTIISEKSTTESTRTRQPYFGTTTSVTEFATETDDINMETDLTTSRLTKRVINDLPTTASPGTKQSDFGTTTNVTEQRTKTTDINHVKTSPSANTMSVISEAFTTTTSSRTKSVKITTISVITVVGALLTVGIAIVILFLYRRNRKRIIYHSSNSASNDIYASLEGEQTMQMFSSNDRSRNRINTEPFIIQQKQRPGNISVSKYQDPVDMDNQYQRLNFTMRNDLKEVHDDYAMQFYNRASTPAINDDGSKPLKNAGLTKGIKDLKEVYNNYSQPFDALSLPPAVNKDDVKIQIKVRPSVTIKDEKHNNVAYCDTAIVHEDFLYDIPKYSNKSLDNRCSVKK